MELASEWVDILSRHFNQEIEKIIKVHGGDINDAVRFDVRGQSYFFKYLEGKVKHRMHLAEVEGLKAIEGTGTVAVPSDYEVLESNRGSGIVMKYIDTAPESRSYWKKLGTGLALLHQQSSDQFGFSIDNYIGTLDQKNSWQSDWSAFYAAQRILPLIALSFDNSYLGKAELRMADKFCNRINEIYPEEKPSLIHGDLWSGNVLCDHHQNPVLIDPATFYGHREMDIAMSQLFGGFHEDYLESYHEQYPLCKGWQSRLRYGQLYYLLVHLVLFGLSYKASVLSILKEFQ